MFWKIDASCGILRGLLSGSLSGSGITTLLGGLSSGLGGGGSLSLGGGGNLLSGLLLSGGLKYDEETMLNKCIILLTEQV